MILLSPLCRTSSHCRTSARCPPPHLISVHLSSLRTRHVYVETEPHKTIIQINQRFLAVLDKMGTSITKQNVARNAPCCCKQSPRPRPSAHLDAEDLMKVVGNIQDEESLKNVERFERRNRRRVVDISENILVWVGKISHDSFFADSRGVWSATAPHVGQFHPGKSVCPHLVCISNV